MAKHKGLWWTTFIVFIIVAALIGLKTTNLLSVDNSAKPGSFISVPTYGYLKCQQGQDLVNWPSPSTYQSFAEQTIKCTDFGTLLQDCTVTLKTPNASVVKGFNAAMTYRVCDLGQTCTLANGGNGGTVVTLRYLGLFNSNPGTVINVHLQGNQYLHVMYSEGGVFGDLWNPSNAVNKAQYQVSYKPFFIYKYDMFSVANGQKVYNTADCAYNGGLAEANFLIEDVSGGGKLSSDLQKSQILDLNNIRARDAQATYISNFVAIVPQYSLFDDDSKYCYDKKIFQVETVSTPKGDYKVANTGTNKEIKTVDCCNNGDVPSGYYCENFQLKKLSTSEGTACSALQPCPIVGFQPIAGKQVASQECVNGKCSTTYKKVACNNAFDCDGGYCLVDPLNPSNNKCANPDQGNYCGNNLCEASRGETVQSCPKDCTANGTTGPDWVFILLIGFAVLLIILIFVIIKISQNNKGGRRK